MSEQVIEAADMSEDERVELFRLAEELAWKAFDFGMVMGVARHPNTGAHHKNIRDMSPDTFKAHARKLVKGYITPLADALDLDVHDAPKAEHAE